MAGFDLTTEGFDSNLAFLAIRISCRLRFDLFLRPVLQRNENLCTHLRQIHDGPRKCADPELFAGVNELDALTLVLETEGFPAAFFTLLFANSRCQKK
jgi:hypothetical protein